MKKIAKGGFEIADWQEKPAGVSAGPKVTRATVKQKFTGDIKGTGTTEYLMVYRPDKTADYSGVQVIKGSVGVQMGGGRRREQGRPEGADRQGGILGADGEQGQILADVRSAGLSALEFDFLTELT